MKKKRKKKNESKIKGKKDKKVRAWSVKADQ